MNSVPVGSVATEEPQVEVDPMAERAARMQALPQWTFLYRLELANQRAHICSRQYQMAVGEAIVAGGPMSPYPADNFLEQEQFYPDGEEPESDPEAAADEEEDL